jgi:hypothetical protein
MFSADAGDIVNRMHDVPSDHYPVPADGGLGLRAIDKDGLPRRREDKAIRGSGSLIRKGGLTPLFSFAMGLGFFFALSAIAQISATQPSTEPMGPKDVFLGFVSAMIDGQPDAIAPACVASDADAQQIVKEIERMTQATATLRKAMAARFGPAESGDLVFFASPEELDKLQPTIDGNKAVLHGDQIESIELLRVDGQWKIDVAALRRDALPDDPHGYFAAQTRAISRTTDDVLAGKFLSADIAREALAARQMEWENQPTTQPFSTTNP